MNNTECTQKGRSLRLHHLQQKPQAQAEVSFSSKQSSPESHIADFSISQTRIEREHITALSYSQAFCTIHLAFLFFPSDLYSYTQTHILQYKICTSTAFNQSRPAQTRTVPAKTPREHLYFPDNQLQASPFFFPLPILLSQPPSPTN